MTNDMKTPDPLTESIRTGAREASVACGGLALARYGSGSACSCCRTR